MVRAATQQADTGYIPILKQLEEMLAQKQYRSPFEQAPQACNILSILYGPGNSFRDSAAISKPGARWPEIRDLNIPVLQEGLSRFAPGDPRLQRELGHWIFPGQVFQIPKEPSALPPPGFQQELQKLLQEKRIQDRIQPFPRPDIGVKEPIPQPPPVKEPSIVEPEFPDLHPRQRGLSLKQPIEWATIDPEKQKQFDEKAKPIIDMDKLLADYIEWNYTRKGKAPTDEQVSVAKESLARHPEMYQKGFAQEAPKNAIGKVRNFLSRMSEAGADAFTLTEGDMPKATTGNSAADGIADTVGGLMGFLNPEGPAKAFNYARQVLWNIAPKLSTMLKVPVGMIYKS